MKRRNFTAALTALAATALAGCSNVLRTKREMKRAENTLYDILDTNTGEYFTYSKVTNHIDGSPITSAKCDGVIYRKFGDEYFKRNYSSFINIKWFGAKGDGIFDNFQAISKAISFARLSGATLYFPRGIYAVYSQIDLSAGFEGTSIASLKLLGEGEAVPSRQNESVMIIYKGPNVAEGAFFTAGGMVDYSFCSVENITFDGGGYTDYVWHIPSQKVDVNSPDPIIRNKHWSFTNVHFAYSNKILLFIGDKTIVGGNYTLSPKDGDVHMNVFKKCTFWPTKQTEQLICINVAENAYQNTFVDCVSDAGLYGRGLALKNAFLLLRQHQTVINNFFCAPLLPETEDTAVIYLKNGGAAILNCNGEEARFLIRDFAGMTYENNVTLQNCIINDQTVTPRIVINDTSTHPLTLIDCHFSHISRQRDVISSGQVQVLNTRLSDAGRWILANPFSCSLNGIQPGSKKSLISNWSLGDWASANICNSFTKFNGTSGVFSWTVTALHAKYGKLTGRITVDTPCTNYLNGIKYEIDAIKSNILSNQGLSVVSSGYYVAGTNVEIHAYTSNGAALETIYKHIYYLPGNRYRAIIAVKPTVDEATSLYVGVAANSLGEMYIDTFCAFSGILSDAAISSAVHEVAIVE